MENKNLESLFRETLNQFNYSSSLYDNIDQKINSYLFLGSIILAISFESYFLNFLAHALFIVRFIFWTGVSLVVFSVYGLLSLRATRFRLPKIAEIKKMILKYPREDIRASIIDEYILIIKENFVHYKNKDNKLRRMLYFMKIGGIIIFSAIIYILVVLYFY